MKTIVFDFGGVLFHWHPPSLLQREIPHLAHDEPSTAHWVREIFQGYGGDWGEFDRGAVDVPGLVARITARTGIAAHDLQRVVDGVPAELQPKADSVALLARLREAGHRVVYLSNMPAPYADHLERTHAFVGWFEDGVFSARVGHIKPQPEIFALAAQRFGAPADELVFLDDHPPNVAQARASGWNAVHFASAAQAERELRANGWIG